MALKEAVVQKVLVDLNNTTPGHQIVGTGIEVTMIWIRTVPGGVTQFDIKLGNNEAFRMNAGDSLSFRCSAVTKGVFITTAPALPGLFAEILFGIGDGEVN